MACPYCGANISTLPIYKRHLKVMHSKLMLGDSLLCGQNNCPLDYQSFRTLQNHIERHHSDVLLSSAQSFVPPGSDVADEIEIDQTPSSNSEPNHDGSSVECRNLLQEIKNEGAIAESAEFVAGLRSNPKIPLSVSIEIVAACKELFSELITHVETQIELLVKQNDIPSEKATNVRETVAVLRNPFTGLESIYKQTSYFERHRLYIQPKVVNLGQELCPVPLSDGVEYRSRPVTAEYIRQTDLFKSMLSIPGVLHSVKSYLEVRSSDGLICDFKDGSLWQSHPVRQKFAEIPNTLVIPVFDFFDDVETVNPLGSHACIHKVGCKYTIVKGFKPVCNSKLENIFLNMVFKSSDRSILGNKQMFDLYLSEMTELETNGFTLEVDGQFYKVYVCLVQVSGDNLGLNGILGYVESFTASYPCRVCKVKRDQFCHHLMESSSAIRTRETYDRDVIANDCSLSGIKEACAYNSIPSFHVTDNIYCDIFHDLAEGVCRYVMQKLLQHFILQKSYFSLDKLNHRMKLFVYDHSTRPCEISAGQLKGDALIMGAVQMLNFVLGFGLMVGDLVPEGDEVWDLYILLRQVLLFSSGLCFSDEELKNMKVVISEFLQQYLLTFDSSLTLKFHNLTHYPSIIARLGPLYNMWVMRGEAKHADAKIAASCSGNFKNICRTIAVRHQMKQTYRLLAQRGIGKLDVSVKHCESLLLNDVENGLEISTLIGDYGLFRTVHLADCVHVNTVKYNSGLILITESEGLFPGLVCIDQVLLTDTRDSFFICHKLNVISESRHFQAYEVCHSKEMCVIQAENLHTLPSPWPLVCRAVAGSSYVSLIHKIWYENISILLHQHYEQFIWLSFLLQIQIALYMLCILHCNADLF